jgi:hypothetical protein
MPDNEKSWMDKLPADLREEIQREAEALRPYWPDDELTPAPPVTDTEAGRDA